MVFEVPCVQWNVVVFWRSFYWDFFRTSLRKFGQKFFARPKICLLLHLCLQRSKTLGKHKNKENVFEVGVYFVSGVRRKFSWGGFFQWYMVVICIWCALFLTSYSCFQAKFVDIIDIFFYTHSLIFVKNQALYTPLIIKFL